MRRIENAGRIDVDHVEASADSILDASDELGGETTRQLMVESMALLSDLSRDYPIDPGAARRIRHYARHGQVAKDRLAQAIDANELD